MHPWWRTRKGEGPRRLAKIQLSSSRTSTQSPKIYSWASSSALTRHATSLKSREISGTRLSPLMSLTPMTLWPTSLKNKSGGRELKWPPRERVLWVSQLTRLSDQLRLKATPASSHRSLPISNLQTSMTTTFPSRNQAKHQRKSMFRSQTRKWKIRMKPLRSNRAIHPTTRPPHNKHKKCQDPYLEEWAKTCLSLRSTILKNLSSNLDQQLLKWGTINQWRWAYGQGASQT